MELYQVGGGDEWSLGRQRHVAARAVAAIDGFSSGDAKKVEGDAVHVLNGG